MCRSKLGDNVGRLYCSGSIESNPYRRVDNYKCRMVGGKEYRSEAAEITSHERLRGVGLYNCFVSLFRLSFVMPPTKRFRAVKSIHHSAIEMLLYGTTRLS